ncbi:hypothetical protein GGF50DRAFT_116487 [Schizophyllum commune]
MSEGNSPISSSDMATAWLAPKGEEIDLNGVSVQLLATRIIAMQYELEFASRERDRYRDDCHQLVGERDRLIKQHDRYRAECHHLVEERDCYKAQRDHYRTERDRYRDQRNYLRNLLQQEMCNKDAAKRAEERLVAVEKSNGRARGGVVGGEEVLGGGEEMTPVVWDERVPSAWAQAPMSSVRAEGKEQEDVPLDLVWDPASQALSSSVAVRPASSGLEEAPSASLAWEEERSAMMMGELGLFDDDDGDDEGGREDLRDGVRVSDTQGNAKHSGGSIEGYLDASAEDLHVDDTHAATKSPAVRLDSLEADFSSYPVLDSSMYPAPGALSPPSPSVSLPPSPTVSGRFSPASSARGSSEEDREGSGEDHGSSNYRDSSQERPSTPSPRRSLPLRLRDRAGWGMRCDRETDVDKWEAAEAEEAEGAQTRIDPRRCVEDSLGEDHRGGFTDEGTFGDCPEDYVEDYTEEYATAMDDEAQAADDHQAPDYSLVLDGLVDFCLGARGGLNETGGPGSRSAHGSPATHNEGGGPGGLTGTVSHGGLADSVGPGFRHASTDDQLLSRISLSSLDLGVHCDLSEEMEVFGAGMALLGGRGGAGASVSGGFEGANPVFSRPSADTGLRQSHTNVGNSPSGTTVSTPSDASNANNSSGWYGADGQQLKLRRQHQSADIMYQMGDVQHQHQKVGAQHQAGDVLYQTSSTQHQSRRGGPQHLTNTTQVKMADVLYQTPGDIMYQTSAVRLRPAQTSNVRHQSGDTLYQTSDVQSQPGDTLYRTSGFQHPAAGPQPRPDLGQKIWPSGYTPENSNWFEDGYDPAEDVFDAEAGGEVQDGEVRATHDVELDGAGEHGEAADVPADDNDAVHDSQEADHAGFIDDLGAGDHYDDPVWENADEIEESAEADWDLPGPRYGCLGRAPRGITRGGGMNRVCSTQSLWDAWDGADDDDEEWDGEGDDKSFVTC